MKTIINHIQSLIFILILLSAKALAQNPPYISSIDKTSASANETLTIVGINFPTNAGDLTVKFGAADASIISTSATLIEVTVPANATLDNVSVTDKSSGLTAYSNEVFNIRHGGNSFALTDLDPLHSESTGFIKTFDICMCDFDNDGLTDIVTTNEESNSINIFSNNSTNTTISLNNNSINLGVPTVNTTCGDIDGDGMPDLVVTRGGSGADRFFVLRNTSPGAGTISFNTPGTSIFLPTQQPSGDVRSPKRPIIQDMDLDGKPEIIVTNLSDNVLYIYKNNGSGSISFVDPPSEVVISQITTSSGVDVKDLNNDGFPEIALVQDQNGNIIILPNNSEPGSIVMGEVVLINIGSRAFRNLKSGDLDNDGFNDLVITSTNPGQATAVSIIKNTTATGGGSISFDTPILSTDVFPSFGVDLVDIEGDGDLDIVTVSQTNGLFILTNTDPNNLTFLTQNISLPKPATNIKTGDINGDGKPDLVFTYNSGDGETGELAIITNRNCVTPVITPSTDRTICTGTTIRLNATGLGTNYDWKLDGGTVKTGSDNFIDITGTAGTYTVTLTDGLTCSQTSNSVIITVDADPTFVVTAGSDTGGAVVCAGTNVNLSATDIAGATYTWTGPNGFTSVDRNPLLGSVTADMAGTYTVFAEANGCTSNISTATVLIETVPLISVRNTGQDVFCEGSSIQLSVTDHIGSYTYDWERGGTSLGVSTTTLTVTEAGDYSAVITADGSGCFVESPARNIERVTLPVPIFTATDATDILTGGNTSICKDLEITFAATSTGAAGFTINNTWDFGDGTTDNSNNNTAHTYTAAGSNTVTLTATYPDIQSCSTTEQATLDLTITDIPTVAITIEEGVTEKCPSEALRLTIPANFSNYVWSSGETINFINALDPDTYSVSATDQFGCDFTTDGIAISNFVNSGITISSSSPIDETDRSITLLEGQLSVELSVDISITNVAWTPANLIEDTTQRDVEVFIQDVNTLVTVFGDDVEGCMESDTVRIINPNINAKHTFSPNGDGIGDDCWQITNSSDTEFSECTIFIFDTKGRLVQELTGPFPDDCVWEGNINGSPAPEGVYFYALKCSGTTSSLSGSILLGR